MYANLQMKVKSGSLPADLRPLALGMLRTLEDLLGLSKGLSLDWAHVVLSKDHHHFIEVRLDVFELVRLTRVSKQAHALYKDKLTALLKARVSKNPATRLLEAYLPERHRFPRPPALVDQQPIFIRFDGRAVYRVEDVPYIRINIWDENRVGNPFEICVGMSYNMLERCFSVQLNNMGCFMQHVRFYSWKNRHSVLAYEDEEGNPHPPIDGTRRHSFVTVRLFGRAWRGLSTDFILTSPSCKIYFKDSATDALITFVRDVIRTVCPTIAPSIPLTPPNMKDGEAGDGGAAPPNMKDGEAGDGGPA
jgi:hypothetical protein